MLKGGAGTAVEGGWVLVAWPVDPVCSLLRDCRESRELREERVGAGEAGVDDRLEELASRRAELLSFNLGSTPALLLRLREMMGLLESSSSPSSSSPVRPSALLEMYGQNLLVYAIAGSEHRRCVRRPSRDSESSVDEISTDGVPCVEQESSCLLRLSAGCRARPRRPPVLVWLAS